MSDFQNLLRAHINTLELLSDIETARADLQGCEFETNEKVKLVVNDHGNQAILGVHGLSPFLVALALKTLQAEVSERVRVQQERLAEVARDQREIA